MRSESGGTVELTRNEVTGNQAAQGRGGGVFIRGGSGSQSTAAVVNRSTVSGNSAETCGGLFVKGDATLTHATLTFNHADTHAGLDIDDGTLTLNSSLIVQAGRSACNQAADSHTNTLVTGVCCTGQATDAAAIDLAPLAGLGGPTETRPLGVGSVAIDGAGDCAADFGINIDLRSLPRPGGNSAACDIGAFEFQGDGDGDVIFQDRFE